IRPPATSSSSTAGASGRNDGAVTTASAWPCPSGWPQHTRERARSETPSAARRNLWTSSIRIPGASERGDPGGAARRRGRAPSTGEWTGRCSLTDLMRQDATTLHENRPPAAHFRSSSHPAPDTHDSRPHEKGIHPPCFLSCFSSSTREQPAHTFLSSLA